jgi:osmotically-inducible protein OsmY
MTSRRRILPSLALLAAMALSLPACTTQLRSKLLLDKNVRAINFNVETVNGVVYLIGIAQDQAELERVTNHARTITNVVKVVSHARLKDDPVN